MPEGLKITQLKIDEVSGVDEAANLMPGWAIMKSKDIAGITHAQAFDGEGNYWVADSFLETLEAERGEQYALDHVRTTLTATKRIPTAKGLDFVKLLDRRSTKKPAVADAAQPLDERSTSPKSKPDPSQTLLDDEDVGQNPGMKLPWASANGNLPSLTIDLAR
jgi:hypothetical protein